jgi:hypothetical protein
MEHKHENGHIDSSCDELVLPSISNSYLIENISNNSQLRQRSNVFHLDLQNGHCIQNGKIHNNNNNNNLHNNYNHNFHRLSVPTIVTEVLL